MKRSVVDYAFYALFSVKIANRKQENGIIYIFTTRYERDMFHSVTMLHNADFIHNGKNRQNHSSTHIL